MKQEDDKVGCSVIKGMRKDIADMKKSRFSIHPIAWAFCILGFIVAIGFLGRTFWPPRLPEKIIYEIKLDSANGEKSHDAAIKKELAEALIAVEARAANNYNDKFITLLTVLTIFGIAWPLIVAFVQYKFNERELDQIRQARKGVLKSLIESKGAQTRANQALEETRNLKVTIEDLRKKNLVRIQTVFEAISITFSAMAVGASPEYQNYYFSLVIMSLSWAMVGAKELGVSSTNIEHMLGYAKRIDPESVITDTTKGCRDYLALCKSSLSKNIKTEDHEQILKMKELLDMIDAKIAAYDKLLGPATHK